jgi:hypothetical protein
MIWGMHRAGASRADIIAEVKKADKAPVGARAVDAVIARMEEEPRWRGTDPGPGETDRGRPSELDDADRKAIKKVVFDHNAEACVTTRFIRRKLKYLRHVSRWCISRALEVAGLAWLSRRLKRVLTKPHRDIRVAYAKWIKEKRQDYLDRFGYTDGTTIYLARTETELQDKKRAALGKFCWRMASGKDGLKGANVGPSMYAKAQGLPVKIWGLLANGRLEYFVLPKDQLGQAKSAKVKAKARAKAKGKPKRLTGTTNMTIARYVDLVNSKFRSWRKSCFKDDGVVHLVQDGEWCLWNERSLAALKKAGFDVLHNYPVNSPDLSAIENWWARLRDRLDATAPTDMESRNVFLCRLRRQVTWLNDNASADALKLCQNQKERANDVLKGKPPGARTKW